MKNVILVVALALTGVAAAQVRYVEVPVEDIEPIIEDIRYVEPEERCRFETVRERARHDSHPHASAPIVGAVLGGALGHAMGHKKRNKQVGAVVGAVLGGAIAHDIAHDSTRAGAHPRRIRLVRQEVCDVADRVKQEKRVTGYMVTYRYGGETYRSRLAHRPGANIRIRVQIGPA